MKNKNILKLIRFILLIIIILILIILMSSKKENDNNTQQNITNQQEEIIVKERYECNEFSINTVTTEELLRMYLEDYKFKMLNEPEKAYELINKDYREIVYGSLEEYKKYINSNIEEFRQMTLDKYQIVDYDNYSEYICVDQYNNYYIFNVTSVMNYTLKLDKYTVDSEEDINSYNKSTIREKVMINIQKVMDAINDRNYNYVYEKLDEEFKNNKYSTKEILQKEIEKNLFAINKPLKNELKNEGETYINYVEIVDANDETKKKKMTIIMQLKEGTDFVMSFSFE